ncbi:MAG: sigma-70 family RNA polymerase sigma factor [Myxococcaceae bacterium]
MPEFSDLDQLMKGLSEGNREVFSRVFELLWQPILHLCVRLMGENDGADVAQSSMLHILERANEYDWRRPALPWALAIATWECRTQLKRKERLRETSDEKPSDSDQGAAADEQEQRVLLAAAMDAMGTLSEADQQTLIATYWETATPVSGATLRKRRARALGRLRDAFRRLYGLD